MTEKTEAAKKKARPPKPKIINEEEKEFGARLKVIRTSMHLRQGEMAELLGVSQPFYSLLEKGERFISIQMLKKICDLGFQPEWILYGKNIYVDQGKDKVLEELQQYLPDLHAEQLRFLKRMAKLMRLDNLKETEAQEGKDET